MRYDSDTTILRDDCVLCFKWDLASWRRHDYDTFTSLRFNTTATQHAVSSVVQSPTIRHRRVNCEIRRREYQEVYGAVLISVSVRDEANNKLVKLAGENSILYHWRNPSYSRKDQNWLLWEKIGKGLDKSGKWFIAECSVNDLTGQANTYCIT